MTIKDIARLAGVSVSTVSRVLNDHPDVSETAKEKVLAVVNEYNYIPNTSARELGKSTSDNIGVVVRGMSNPFYTKIITEIGDKIEKAGYTMVMQQIGTSDDEILTAARMERDKKLLGLIFLGGRLNYSKEQVSSINVPFVCCTFNNQYGNLDNSEYSSVGIDDNQAAYEAVEYLYKEGHRRIAVLLSGPDDGSVSQVRFEGYERALNDFGIELDENLIISINSFNIADAYEGMKDWLKHKHDFSAVFAISDNMAMGAMKALREAGKEMPKDVALIAIDGIEASEYMNPVLTTLCQPMEEMGSEAVKLAVDIIRGKKQHKHIVLSTKLREGETLR
ncbi:LacI family transcriptional regulator [Pseudobutyrivibrio xylanivorans]|uniref:LacI family transcriptional regulator n=1 Tax=Pseudobutyrivibrio xylanivorans TaxID=185007 RepID=A0A5P6VPQ1_PSEXY|nr:LacI family transcriptional regulator [Pseudobutyrivibrio xylanivorans]